MITNIFMVNCMMVEGCATIVNWITMINRLIKQILNPMVDCFSMINSMFMVNCMTMVNEFTMVIMISMVTYAQFDPPV